MTCVQTCDVSLVALDRALLWYLASAALGLSQSGLSHFSLASLVDEALMLLLTLADVKYPAILASSALCASSLCKKRYTTQNVRILTTYVHNEGAAYVQYR